MMTLLARYLQHPLIIDIGCGSGILALSAVAMGAPRAFGIDIDQGAIEHSIQNAHLNQLEKQCFFSTPSSFSWNVTSEPLLILMNMIHTEQEIAWHSLPALHDQPGELLTSGVRIEERGVYLDQMTRRGWALIDEREEEGWLGFYFCRSEKIPSLFN
jgi:ribosomal protein L11 methyltransferase